MTTPLSASNHRIKRLRKLVGKRKARSEERVFVVEGPVLVAEALASADPHGDGAVEAVYVDVESLREAGPVADAVSMARTLDVPVYTVFPDALRASLDTVTSRPIAAIVGRRSAAVRDLDDLDGPVLVLHELSEPGNVGTLIRTAEAAGVAGVVCSGRGVDPTNPKAVRAAAGAMFRLPVVDVADLSDAGGRRPLIATVVAGGPEVVAHDAADLADAAIVLGNEAHGLDDAAVAACDRRVTIELAGPTESLNVAAAGAVILFESLRQRRPNP